jgi:hypothetical protein
VSDLALDADGDLMIRGGDAVIIRGADATAQDWRLRLGLFRGEWTLDRRVGIDYAGLIFDGQPTNPLMRNVFERVTLETAGVKTLDRLDFSFDRGTRELTVQADVTMDSGVSQTLVYSDVLFSDDELAT